MNKALGLLFKHLNLIYLRLLKTFKSILQKTLKLQFNSTKRELSQHKLTEKHKKIRNIGKPS